MLDKILEQEAISVDTYEAAAQLQKILVENGYCVMLSREESLWMINWVWSPNFADRNDVVFLGRELYECSLEEFEKEIEEEFKKEIKENA